MQLSPPRRASSSGWRGALVLVVLSIVAVGLAGSRGDGEGSAPTPNPTGAPTQLIAAASPQDLQSYRYSVSLLLQPSALPGTPPDWPADQELHVAVQGEWVHPDREHTVSSVDLGIGTAVQTESIRIGDQSWMRVGSGPWREAAGDPLQGVAGLDFSPAALFADDSAAYGVIAQRLAEHPWTEETVQGIATRRFSFTEAEFYEIFEGQQDLLPVEVDAEITAELWLSVELGVPVSVVLRGRSAAGVEILVLQLDLWDLNAEEIAVEPPL